MQKLMFGDIITYKNGNRGIYSDNDTIVFEDGIVGGKVYWECVRKIERYVKNEFSHSKNVYYIKTIYISKDVLDKSEKEYLRNLVSPFRYHVKSITKVDSGYLEYIHITMDEDSNTFSLPFFHKGTMYKGMESEKDYSIDELELFK